MIAQHIHTSHMSKKVSALAVSIITLFLMLLSNIGAHAVTPGPAFSRFSFGCAAEDFYACPKNADTAVGPWVLGQWQTYHTNWLNNFKTNESKNTIPYIHTYIIAGLARSEWGLQDCNVGSNNTLCQKGADYIRNRSDKINQTYIDVAKSIKTNWGTSRPLLMHLEPDFYQYHNDSQQQNKLSLQESWDRLNLISQSIKGILPNAHLVLDISPWNSELATWSRGFQGFSYGGMVGKSFPADGVNGSNTIDGKTYRQMYQQVNLPLIVDTAYGAGGGLTSFDWSWTPRQTLTDRYYDGVAAIIQPGYQHTDYYSGLINEFKLNPIR